MGNNTLNERLGNEIAVIYSFPLAHPATEFVQLARNAGAHTVEINLEPSAVESAFHEHIYGLAGKKVPDFIHDLLKNTKSYWSFCMTV